MANFYVRSTSSSLWVALTANGLGDRRVATTAATAARQSLVYECTTAGTTGAAEPTWNTTVGGTTTDATVTWTTRQATTWANAHAFLSNLLNDSAGGVTNADTVWVSQVHAETRATAITMTCPTSPGLNILCGNDAAAPPTALATTATVTTTGNVTHGIDGHAYTYGITFATNNTGNSADIKLPDTQAALNHNLIFDTCGFQLLGASANCDLFIGGNTSNNLNAIAIDMRNCTYRTGHAGQIATLGYGNITLSNFILHGSGTAPTTLFQFSTGDSANGNVLIERSDLTGRTWTNFIAPTQTVPSRVRVRNCRMPAAFAFTTGAIANPAGPAITFDNCSAGSNNYTFSWNAYSGTVIEETTIVCTEANVGATDLTTPISHEYTTNGSATFQNPLSNKTFGKPYVVWNDDITGTVTVTIEVVHDSLTALNDNEIWMELEYLSSATTTQGSLISDGLADILASPAAQTTSTVAWTTTGITNVNKQKLSVAPTAGRIGPILVWVYLAKASKTVWVNPKPILS